MQTKQTITLGGFYSWDPTLFDNLIVPDGLDKDALVDNILLEAGERSVIYSDPDFLKMAIGIWSRTHQPTFERWVKALAIKYDPLVNYDRKEDWTDDLSRSTQTATSTQDTQNSTSSGSGNVTESRVAYPDNTLHTTGKSEDSNTLSQSVTGSGSGTGSETLSEGSVHSGRITGNIGVTTSQQMLQAELDLGYWNIIQRITNLFIQNFILMLF